MCVTRPQPQPQRALMSMMRTAHQGSGTRSTARGKGRARARARARCVGVQTAHTRPEPANLRVVGTWLRIAVFSQCIAWRSILAFVLDSRPVGPQSSAAGQRQGRRKGRQGQWGSVPKFPSRLLQVRRLLSPHTQQGAPKWQRSIDSPSHTHAHRTQCLNSRLLASARTRCRAHSALRRIRRTELARQYMGLRAQHRAAPADAGDVSHARKKPTLLQMVRRVAFLERL